MIDGPFFKLNEELKEKLVINFKGKKAITFYKKSKDMPLLESELHWENVKDFLNLSAEEVSRLTDLLNDYHNQIHDLGGYMTKPYFEIHAKKIPVMVWGVFEK